MAQLTLPVKNVLLYQSLPMVADADAGVVVEVVLTTDDVVDVDVDVEVEVVDVVATELPLAR